MNRQQKRTRIKLTRAEWCLRMAELQKTMPKDPLDDIGMAQLLTGIIVDEQLNVSETNLATLVGLACACMERAWKALPPAKHVDTNGRPVYSVEQVAAWTGQTEAQTLQGLTAIAEETGVTLACDTDVQPLH